MTSLFFNHPFIHFDTYTHTHTNCLFVHLLCSPHTHTHQTLYDRQRLRRRKQQFSAKEVTSSTASRRKAGTAREGKWKALKSLLFSGRSHLHQTQKGRFLKDRRLFGRVRFWLGPLFFLFM
ncbi:hypothetical protein K456DRAFT_144127 [Colletotrichum gloeosporioides 23]|nr:hypothetical protein K456DRAFT_144127 [Colletotrichum gloeosporioides 23]